MMVTVHGLPPNTKYNDIKTLIKEKCNLSDFILGTLGLDRDRTKKVRVGLASDSEGDLLIKYLDGYRISGHVIRIVPIGKSANEMPQMNISNDTYQWRNNQEPAELSYGNTMEPIQNQPGAWLVGQSNAPWTNNDHVIPQHIQSQNNFGYVQSVTGPQQSYYNEQSFPQGRGPQGISHNLAVIEPQRGNPSRPHVLTNVVITDQQPSRQPIQGERYPNQRFNNPDKPQTITKDHFQGPSYMGQQPNQAEKGRYQGQQWTAQERQDKIERFPKQHSTKFEKPNNNKMIQSDNRQVMSHNPERNIDTNQYEKGGRRFSPLRDHRISPNGHRILPSGRRISPAPSNTQFKSGISPSGRNIVQSDRRISPSGRKISPSGRKISPSGRRISPSGRRISPSGRRISPSARRISPAGRRISPSGRRISPSSRRISPSGRRISPSGRRMSPSERRISPTGRRISPPGRRFSPPGRRFSPCERQSSPSGRNMSAGHQVLQSGRHILEPGRKISPSGRRFSPPGSQISPSGRQIVPSGRQNLQPGRRISPPGRPISPPGRRISPPGRRISPSGRQISPPRRKFSPSGRRISPSRRNISPSRLRISPDRSFLPAGRRVSPAPRISPGRRISPTGRRISPTGRRMSPVRRTSPSERRVSPGHRTAPMNKGPQGDRHMAPRLSPIKPALNRKMSPGRHVSPNRGPPPRTYDRYSPSRKPIDNLRAGPAKEARPPYTSIQQAQNQPMYSGGYLPDNREIEQYPTAGPRKSDQRPIWQEREKSHQPLAKSVDDRRDVPGMQKYDSRRGGDYPRAILNPPETKILSPSRTSRSPNRRDRSPVRDRFRRHSPSPRSPRRSWALEKRRSPDNIEPPPPPSWPERQENAYSKENRQNDERNSKKPVWEKPEVGQKPGGNPTFYRKEDRRSYDREDRKYFISPTRSRWDSHQQPKQDEELRDRSPVRSRPAERYTPNRDESKLSRQDFDTKRRNEFQRHGQGPRNQEPQIGRYAVRDKNKKDFDEFLNKNDDYREGFDHREQDLYMGQENLDREIEDVYKRAAELTNKTEQYQRKRNENTTFSKDRNHHRKGDDNFINRRDGPSRQDFYETTKSRFDRNPRHVDEMCNVDLAPAVQYKRDKAVDEITGKILTKFAPDLTGKIRDEIEELLKISIEDMIFEMFGEKDVSFIEIVIKFEDRYGVKDMEKIFDNIISKFPIEVRLMKRSARDVSPSPAKIPRSSSSVSMRGAKAFSKAKPIREAPMKTPIAVKRTIPMNRREPVKRPMIRNESAQNFVPTKRKLPIRKVVPAKVPGGKVVPTKNSGAVIIGKPVLRMVPAKKCNPDTKSTTVKETLEKKPSEIIKSKRVDTNTKKPADVKIIPSTSTTETVAQPVVKEERKEEAKVLPSGQEYQELSHQLSCALDSELEDIMIKVWQELPENPATKAEELVVEKIRNEAGDDLRNVLGLNITKRLLNIHNSLYVKLQFKARPERGTLIQFIKKYKLKSFKRIRDDAPVFAAQFNNIDDYDRICNEEVYCGQVKVQVKPCYNFTSCPPNLRTIFSDKDIKQKINSEHCAEESVENQTKQETQRKEPIETKDGEKKQENKNDEKKTIAKDSVKTDLSVETKSVTKNDNKIERTLIKVEKDESDINKDDKIKSQIADKSKMQVTHNVEAQTNINKPKGIEVIEVKKEKEENKKFDSKVKEDNKESKGLVKENDEIEDQDVLALISEGIVLDECSGSDIE